MTGQRRVFLSDLHLETPDDDRFARFAECLRRESRWSDEIYVLGDLFEAWIGDDDDSDLAVAACATLLEAAAHARVMFLPGNRDFLCGDGFAERAGVVLINDPHETGDGVLLTHGDALCTADSGYIAFRDTVRSAAWRRDMLAKPLQERQRIGAEMRAASVSANANKADNILDVTSAAVTGLLNSRPARALVHGHTHRPAVHRSAATKRYVLGAWERCGWLLRQSDDRFDLECFPLALPYSHGSETALGP